ncbi:MAG: TIGR03013 family XrtA/PEP-CTERM system glycosyltransferase [Terriglobales bacterium]
MVRLFQVYYPVRSLVLLLGEAIVVCASFLLATLLRFGQDSFLVLNYEGGFFKIAGITGVALLCSHYFDLYDSQRLRSPAETYLRILIVLGSLSFLLAATGYVYPEFMLGNNVFFTGLIILTVGLFSWRSAYRWMVHQPFFRERVYVMGGGDRAERLVEALRSRRDLGMDVVGWAGALGNGSLSREALARSLQGLRQQQPVDRVILAMSDRRGSMPVAELLDLRLAGVKVEDATSLLEKITGKIEVDELHPSWLLFSDGFRLHTPVMLMRRVVSTTASLTGLLILLPMLPLIALAIKLSSKGPAFYGQRRVGQNGAVFTCYKFRTMREDAEAATGPTWASGDDPRITRVGHFLRRTRLDEVPQLWNVLRGDMGFVGPRPERPEFVEWLSREIPYYHLRHILRPGLTGWAQINYPYGASAEESKEKLRYDLYYIKNMSLALDLLIAFQTVKILLLRRGSR